MFQLYPGALEAEMERRFELASATMQAVHGVAQFRHAVAMIVLAGVAFVR